MVKQKGRKNKQQKKKKNEEGRNKNGEASTYTAHTIAYTMNHSSIKFLVRYVCTCYMFLIVCLYVCSYFCIKLRDSLCSLPSLLSSSQA